MRREVFEKYQPTIVFHAAAYKHVPLMNTHPLASVRNNVVATKVVSELAAEFEVERFVLISTDKAVRPQTVMGQSKAICEWIDESVGETTHPKIMRLSRPPIDAAWLHEQLEQLARLADEGDTLEVVAKLGAIVREPKRETPVAFEPLNVGEPQPAPGAQLP